MARLPERCRAVAAVPPSAQIADPAIAAHVSAANCWALVVIAQPARADDASATSLAQAMAPSIAILDDVIAHSTPHWRYVADQAKADLYRGMVVRLRSVPGDVAARAALEPRFTTWLATAAQSDVDASLVGSR